MDNTNEDIPTNYALNGKIMLSSVIILFVVVCVVVCFHTYARCCSTRAYHRQRRHRRPRLQLNNPSAANNNNATVDISSSQIRLDPRILKTLPIFVYSSTAATVAALECTVCLSEFENGERGRTLPKCGHAFHVECIDEWFRSHSNCPVCRAPVQPDNIVVVVDQPDTSSAGVVITVIEDPASVSETLDSTGLYGSFPVADFQPEWRPRNAEGLVGLAAGSEEVSGSDLERNRCKSLSLKRIWSI